MKRGSLDFRRKVILAPMVRIGALPTRLLALEYGADIVYTHEVIDHKILQCQRVENELLGTVDYVLPDETIVLRTCQQERDRVVLQIGTCCAERALRVAEFTYRDVAGIDINMGCPKEFSLKGGMGAALLKKPDKIKDILTTLVRHAPKTLTITCKIRVLQTLEETVTLARLIESTGVTALAVHGRKTAERPNHPNRNDIIRAVAEALTIPVIANGGSKDHIRTYSDIESFRQKTGASSVMIARSAMWNLSIFSSEGMIPMEEILLVYLKRAVLYDFHIHSVKYTMQNILHEELETVRGKRLLAANTVRDVCEIWNLEDYYDGMEGERVSRKQELRRRAYELIWSDVSPAKRPRSDDLVTMEIKLERKDFRGPLSPKQLLHEYTRKADKPPPIYTSILDPGTRLYSSVCLMDDRSYATTVSHMSKKYVEQACATVCLRTLGLDDGLPTVHKDQGDTSVATTQVKQLSVHIREESTTSDDNSETSTTTRNEINYIKRKSTSLDSAAALTVTS